MFGVVWDHKDPYQAVYHVCSHFRPISVHLCKESIFTLKKGYFRLFFTKLPILAEYASALAIQILCQTANPPQIPLEVLKEMGGFRKIENIRE